ncbi:hypothetical protein K461DRAFT_280571 [Myriangium duriaei CBS 260.36]|uniref:Integral membrane protein n=1 Tax=Myriangium duriaei CBS 260.36 TaxID=1168546 RepID=A0A9P4MI28_9PEZI|nr:hypothetical protein K461DRAFT_280571 [Myriangium duriaei CBS 260.36]
MSNGWLKIIVSEAPLSYTPPSFPSLYWPFPVGGTQTYYLYDAHSIWRFTLLWTIISITGVHLVAAFYAVLMQSKNWKVIWVVPIIYGLIGGIESIIAGNVVGGLLAGVYTAGFFRMSTWIPFVWGVINALTLILSSFAIQGGM